MKRDVRKFIRANLGPSALGMLTGQDSRALDAFVALLELYSVSDAAGQARALAAMAQVLHAAQPKTHIVFRQAIPFVFDWSDEAPMWARIGGAL